MHHPVQTILLSAALLATTLIAPAAAQPMRAASGLSPSLAPAPICGRPGRVEAGSYALHAAQRAAERAWTREVAAVLPAEFTRLSNADPQRSRGRCAQLDQGRWTCQLIATPCSRQSRRGPFRPW